MESNKKNHADNGSATWICESNVWMNSSMKSPVFQHWFPNEQNASIYWLKAEGINTRKLVRSELFFLKLTIPKFYVCFLFSNNSVISWSRHSFFSLPQSDLYSNNFQCSLCNVMLFVWWCPCDVDVVLKLLLELCSSC